jgi:hypothetical protein
MSPFFADPDKAVLVLQQLGLQGMHTWNLPGSGDNRQFNVHFIKTKTYEKILISDQIELREGI